MIERDSSCAIGLAEYNRLHASVAAFVFSCMRAACVCMRAMGNEPGMQCSTRPHDLLHPDADVGTRTSQ